jgi:hypothetical protein
VLFLLAATVFVTVRPSASLAVCNVNEQTGNCYGVTDFIPSGTYTGADAVIESDRLSVVSSSDFSANRLLICPGNFRCLWTVEEGWNIGRRDSCSDGCGSTGLTFYWAERPPSVACGDYHEHYGGYSTPVMGTAYHFKISYSGNGKWGIYLNNIFHSNTVSNCYDSNAATLETGGEISASSAEVDGSSTGLLKRGSDGQTWTYNWGNSSNTTTITSETPFCAWWGIPFQALSYITDGQPC